MATKNSPFLILDTDGSAKVPFSVSAECQYGNSRCGTISYIELDYLMNPKKGNVEEALKNAGDSGDLPFKFNDDYYYHKSKSGPAYITEITYDEEGNETFSVSETGELVPRNDFSLEIKSKEHENTEEQEEGADATVEKRTAIEFKNLLIKYPEFEKFLSRSFNFVFDSELVNMPLTRYVTYGIECCGNASPKLEDLSNVTANTFYVIPKYEVDLKVKAYFQKNLKTLLTINNFEKEIISFLKSFSFEIDITERYKGKTGAKSKLVIENVGGIAEYSKEIIATSSEAIKSVLDHQKSKLLSAEYSNTKVPPYLSLILDLIKAVPKFLNKQKKLLEGIGLKETTSKIKQDGKGLSDAYKEIRSELKKDRSKRKKLKLGFRDFLDFGMTAGLPKLTYTSKSELQEGDLGLEIERTISKIGIEEAFGFWIKLDLALIFFSRIPITAIALAVSKGLNSPHLELSTDKDFLTGLSKSELDAHYDVKLRVTIVIHGHIKATVTGNPLSMDIGSSKVNQLNYQNESLAAMKGNSDASDGSPAVGYTDWGNVKTEFDAGIWAEGKVYIFSGGLNAEFSLYSHFFICDTYAVRKHANGQPHYIFDSCLFFNGLSVAWTVDMYAGVRVNDIEGKKRDALDKGDQKITELPTQELTTDTQITDPDWRQNRIDQLTKEREPWHQAYEKERKSKSIGLGLMGATTSQGFNSLLKSYEDYAYKLVPGYTPAMEDEYQRLVKYQIFYKKNKDVLAAIEQLNLDMLTDPTGGTFEQLDKRFNLMQKIHADMLKLGYPTKPGEYILGSLQEEYNLRDRYQKFLEEEGSIASNKKKEALQDMDDIGHETLFGARLFGARKYTYTEREKLREKLMKEKFKVPK